MDMQDVSRLVIPEGEVKTIHDKNGNLLWGKIAYDVKYGGDASQEKYSGVQLLTKNGMATPSTDTSFWFSFSSSVISLTPQEDGWGKITQEDQAFGNFQVAWSAIDGMQTSTTYTLIVELRNVVNGAGSLDLVQNNQNQDPFESFEVITGASATNATNARVALSNPDAISVLKVVTKSTATSRGLRFFTRNSVPSGVSFEIRTTILLGDHSSDWQNYCGENWQPYVGGMPAPSPDYPQEIQTVTGSQTIAISDGVVTQSFTVNLGSTELCKIGDYQDYIYRDGDNWYIHKENSVNTPDLSESQVRDYANASYCTFRKPVDYSEYGTYLYDGYMLCSHAIVGTSPSGGWNNANGIGKAWLGAERTNVWIGFAPGTTLDEMKAALSGVKMYYPVKTPTNIEITNAGLISQLNSVDQFLTRIPYNYSVSGDLATEIVRNNV